MAIVSNVMVGVANLYYNTTTAAGAGAVVTQFGFTEDGVTIEYNPTIADIEVEEETFPVGRVITKEEVTITCNVAENQITNLEQALAGALGAAPLVLGAGTLQDFSLKIVGVSPAGTRTIYVPYAHSIGVVAMSYRKGEKTIIPVSFKAYQGTAGGSVVTITG